MRPFPTAALREVLRWAIDWATAPGPAVGGEFTLGAFGWNQPGVNTMAQGYIGQTAEGRVVLHDADPRTEGATYETVTFASDDAAVAAVAPHPDDPLRCNVLLLAAGTTRVTCDVDPGQGEPLHLAVDVESREPTPGEAVGGTFELGEFVEQPQG